MDANGRRAGDRKRSFSTARDFNSDFEDEFENEFEDIWETDPQTINSEFEDVWETPVVDSLIDSDFNRQVESEWEFQETTHQVDFKGQGDQEESERSSRSVLQAIKNTAQQSIPQAQQLATIAPQVLLGKPLNSKASLSTNPQFRNLLRQGEAAAVDMETQLLSLSHGEVAIGNSSAAYEAALTEILAAEASHSPNPSEGPALLGAAVPSALKSMEAQQALRPAMLPLVQISHRLAQIFRQSGATGQKLQRLMPTIWRRVIGSLQAAQREGKAIDAALIQQLMAEHTAQVLKNPATVTTAIVRNAMIRRQAVKPKKPLT